MAQTITQGTRDVVTAGDQIIAQENVGNKIDLLTKDKAPWTIITRAAKKHKAVGDTTYYVYDDLVVKKITTLSAAVAVSATTWNVATGTGKYISGWDMLWNRTRNVFVHVQSVSTDAITVIANYDSGTDTAGQVGDEVVIMGPYTQEAGGLTQARTTQETKRTNYIMDLMTALSFSDYEENARFIFEGHDDVDYQKMKAAIAHQRQLHMSWLLGPNAALVAGSGTYENPLINGTFSIGVTQSLRALMNASADTDHIVTDTDLTESEFIDKFEPAFFAEDEAKNADDMLLICPPGMTIGMMKWELGKGRFSMDSSKKEATLGMKFTRWQSPLGDVKIIQDTSLKSTISGGTHFYFIVDTSRLGYVPYKGLDTHMTKLPKTASTPKVSDLYWRTVAGTAYTQPNAHVWGKYVTMS